jgi:hypothetical protein
LRKVSGGFELDAQGDVVTVRTSSQFASREAAQQALPREKDGASKLLRAWQISVPLSSRLPRLDFELERETVIGADNSEVFGTGHRSVPVRIALALTVPECPPPPDEFVASWEVEAMWAHYERYLQGGEPLLAMAYFCLTVLEWSAGARTGKLEAAAQMFNIDKRVLDAVSKLTSILGSVGTARKLDRVSSQRRDPSTPERAFLEAAIKAMIRRAGEYAFAPTTSWPRITLRDLPTL